VDSLVEACDVPGWYGKLASLGDFAHRRLPPQWVSACDGWLSVVMQAGREALGEHWLQAYLTAPLLRFGWAPGVIDPQWWFGVLMPSCDSVGRYFPLLIAQPRVHAPQDRIALDHLERWFDHLARAAMDTLNEAEGSVDALEAALLDAPPWPTPGRGAALAMQQREDSEHYGLGLAAPLAHWVHALAARDFTAHLAGCTLWWRVTPERMADSIEIVHGLPDGRVFAGMLTGEGMG
jgi:type VI secretion system protein ImpM